MIKDLLKAIDQEGDSVKDRLLHSYVYIYEKTEGTHIKFEYNSDIFEWELRRPGDRKVDYIDATLMRFYKDVMEHFDGLETAGLGKDLTFSFRYDHARESMILTHALTGDGDEIMDPSVLEEHARELNIIPPPLLYSGELDGNLTEAIMQSVTTGDTLGFLDDEDRLDTKPLLLKIEDDGPHYLLRQAQDQKSSKGNPNDFYWVLVNDFTNFLKHTEIGEYSAYGSTREHIYVNIISALFNDFFTGNTDRYEDVDFEKPEFLQQDSFALTRENISDPVTSHILSDYAEAEDVLKIVLNAFRKEKSRLGGVMDKGRLDEFNSYVSDIQKQVEKHLVKSDSDVNFKTFKQVNGIK